MPNLLVRFLPFAFALALSACGPTVNVPKAPVVVPGYEGVQDGAFFIDPVPAHYLRPGIARTELGWVGDEKPGDIVVDTHARRLYYMIAPGRAMRYTIAVGREGAGFAGDGTIQRMEEWPSWTPTANMIRSRPDLYADYAGGLPGGLINPLGARAMYLYRGGRDSYFRIHGTRENASIGHATSAGCIRMFNQDAIDLYNRVQKGAYVHVRSLEESIQWEGPMIEDADGYMVPDNAANRAAIAAEHARRAATGRDVALDGTVPFHG